VSDHETDLIIKSGLKAPSASNRQPWFFTVVKNDSLIQDMIPKITSGNILIVISGPVTDQNAASVNFDCGLATENMYLAALSLGLGARIYGSPVKSINSRLKQTLGIPDGYQAIMVLRVGNVDGAVDVASSASTRKPPEELVTYR
jgi:nitroreductase